jgi:hypothetical protein
MKLKLDDFMKLKISIILLISLILQSCGAVDPPLKDIMVHQLLDAKFEIKDHLPPHFHAKYR